MNENIYASKIRFVSILILTLFFLVGFFLFRWQIVDAKKYEAMATERIRNVTIPSLRGSIYASDGSTLAYEERRFDIYVYIPELERAERYGKQTRQEYITKVSKTLGISETDLSNLLNTNSYWIKVASKLKVDKKNEIVNLKRDNDNEEPLEGDFVEYTSERIYPENELACHIIGFYGDNGSGDKEGRAGIESYWEGSLKAFEGFKVEQVDSFENTIPIIDFTPIEEQRGMDIYLTINVQMQKVIEQKLKEAVETYEADAGAVVLMDPKTGALLAVANYPSYDPNNYSKVENEQAYSNRALTVPYEFGSIGKIFTISGAFEEKVVEPTTVILPNGHQGCEYFIDPSKDECKPNPSLCQVCTFDKAPQGPETVADGLVKSDNIALYHTAQVLGADKLYEYLDAFRMGKPTGVEIFEDSGYLKPVKEWNIADLVTYSYGHGYSGTLLQLTSGVSAIPNDGKIMQPYLVEKVVEPDKTVKTMEPRVIAEPVSAETARTVGGILTKVYENNVFEYYNRDLLEYNIAMKSGTALIPYEDKVGYSNDINSTYVGFDMSDEKTFILSVWLNRPRKGTLASQNARVLWISIFREIKDELGVPKTGD